MNAPANVSTRISQPDLVNHGFKRAMGNAASGYILLSDGPASESGRKIYVEGGEVARLLASLILSRGNHKKTLVMSWLSRLRSNAGGFQAFSNKRNGFEHMEVVEDMRICYVILQAGNDRGLGPGVYITDIELAEHAEGHGPGLYKVLCNNNKWKVEEGPDNSIFTHHAAINGLTEDIEDAAQKIMPGIISAAYKDDASLLKSEGYTLVYNPPPLYRRGSEWSTPEQKNTSADFTATQLAKALYDTQMQNREVKWTVHGDGAILLLKALEKLPRQSPLNKHTLFFAAPAPVMAQLFDRAKQHQMNLAKDVMKYQGDDWRNVMARTWQQRQAANQLKTWGGDYVKISDRLIQDSRQNVKTAAKNLLVSKGAGCSLGSMALAIAGGAPAITVIGAAIGSAAFSVWMGADAFRNIMAAYSRDTAINPHLNPMMDSNDFNVQARARLNSKVKSFFGLVNDMDTNTRGSF
ncbi:hypothetical protein [Hahella ganghwensis]|uniref:hypothetical protein n=1 Tax=Hahella ganghwensis TaxID=286420 RepID=UPI0003665F52|nr:hypothetical protein [Hahella ganghwensis]